MNEQNSKDITEAASLAKQTASSDRQQEIKQINNEDASIQQQEKNQTASVLSKLPANQADIPIEMENVFISEDWDKTSNLLTKSDKTNRGNYLLKITCQHIGDQGIERLCQDLQELINITHLKLEAEKNNLTPQAGSHLGRALRSLVSLRQLQLEIGQNQLECEGLESICEGIRRLGQLQQLSLNLKFNTVKRVGTRCLSDALKCLQQLKQLYLVLDECVCITKLGLNKRGNRMRNEGLNHIGESIAALPELKQLYLDVSANSIKKDGLELFAGSLSKCTNLESLFIDFFWNSLGDEGIQSLFVAVQSMPRLFDLNLSLKRNGLTDKGIVTIAAVLPFLKNTVKLSLNLELNEISLEAREVLGRRVGQMRRLTELYLDIQNAEETYNASITYSFLELLLQARRYQIRSILAFKRVYAGIVFGSVPAILADFSKE